MYTVNMLYEVGVSSPIPPLCIKGHRTGEDVSNSSDPLGEEDKLQDETVCMPHEDGELCVQGARRSGQSSLCQFREPISGRLNLRKSAANRPMSSAVRRIKGLFQPCPPTSW